MKTQIIKFVMVLLIGIMVLSTSGCLSYMTYKSSQKKVALRKAVVNNDQAAIRAVQLGDNGAGVGIDVSNWDALSEQPILQLLAAVGDAGLMWAGYEGAKQIDEGISEDEETNSGDTTAGRDAIIIKGNGNTVNTSSTTEPVVGAPATEE